MSAILYVGRYTTSDDIKHVPGANCTVHYQYYGTIGRERKIVSMDPDIVRETEPVFMRVEVSQHCCKT